MVLFAGYTLEEMISDDPAAQDVLATAATPTDRDRLLISIALLKLSEAPPAVLAALGLNDV